MWKRLIMVDVLACEVITDKERAHIGPQSFFKAMVCILLLLFSQSFSYPMFSHARQNFLRKLFTRIKFLPHSFIFSQMIVCWGKCHSSQVKLVRPWPRVFPCQNLCEEFNIHLMEWETWISYCIHWVLFSDVKLLYVLKV